MAGVGPLARTLAAGIRCVSIRRWPVSRLAGTLPPLPRIGRGPRSVPDISSSVRKDTVAAFSARGSRAKEDERGDAREDHRERDGLEERCRVRGGREREREGETGRTFFTIQRIYLRALFVHVIPATYKAFLPLSVVKIQREN